jgi:hypothetical protein
MKTTNYLNFAILSATVIILILIPANHLLLYEREAGDFRGYYAAASVIIDGGNPYDYSQTGAVLRQVTGRIGNNPFYYPPWFGWIMMPFAILPFRTALSVWMLVNVILWTVGLRLLTSVLEICWKGWRLYLLYIILTIVFFWITIKYEQVGILLMVLYLLAAHALKQQKLTEAGLWLGLCLIKPNVMVLPIFGLCAWLSFQKMWRPTLIAASLNLALIVVSLLVTPDWYKPLFAPHAFDGIYHAGVGEAFRYNTTLPHLMVMYGLITWKIAEAMFFPVLFVGIVALAFVIKKSFNLLYVMMLTILIGFAVSPYIQAYDFPILSLLFAFLVTRPLRFVHFIMIGLILAVPLLGPYLTKNYWIIVALAVMFLNNFFRKRIDSGVMYQAKSNS